MKNVAVLGGAFDPVHMDHMRVARTCLDRGFCDEVWFMPSPDRWDKVLKASPEDRFAMLELAFSGDKRLVLSDLEIQQGDFRLTSTSVYSRVPIRMKVFRIGVTRSTFMEQITMVICFCAISS